MYATPAGVGVVAPVQGAAAVGPACVGDATFVKRDMVAGAPVSKVGKTKKGVSGVYYHEQKNEWRARYVDKGGNRRMKTFSTRKYGFEGAQAKAELLAREVSSGTLVPQPLCDLRKGKTNHTSAVAAAPSKSVSGRGGPALMVHGAPDINSNGGGRALIGRHHNMIDSNNMHHRHQLLFGNNAVIGEGDGDTQNNSLFIPRIAPAGGGGVGINNNNNNSAAAARQQHFHQHNHHHHNNLTSNKQIYNNNYNSSGTNFAGRPDLSTDDEIRSSSSCTMNEFRLLVERGLRSNISNTNSGNLPNHHHNQGIGVVNNNAAAFPQNELFSLQTLPLHHRASPPALEERQRAFNDDSWNGMRRSESVPPPRNGFPPHFGIINLQLPLHHHHNNNNTLYRNSNNSINSLGVEDNNIVINNSMDVQHMVGVVAAATPPSSTSSSRQRNGSHFSNGSIRSQRQRRHSPAAHDNNITTASNNTCCSSATNSTDALNNNTTTTVASANSKPPLLDDTDFCKFTPKSPTWEENDDLSSLFFTPGSTATTMLPDSSFSCCYKDEMASASSTTPSNFASESPMGAHSPPAASTTSTTATTSGKGGSNHQQQLVVNCNMNNKHSFAAWPPPKEASGVVCPSSTEGDTAGSTKKQVQVGDFDLSLGGDMNCSKIYSDTATTTTGGVSRSPISSLSSSQHQQPCSRLIGTACNNSASKSATSVTVFNNPTTTRVPSRKKGRKADHTTEGPMAKQVRTTIDSSSSSHNLIFDRVLLADTLPCTTTTLPCTTTTPGSCSTASVDDCSTTTTTLSISEEGQQQQQQQHDLDQSNSNTTIYSNNHSSRGKGIRSNNDSLCMRLSVTCHAAQKATASNFIISALGVVGNERDDDDKGTTTAPASN